MHGDGEPATAGNTAGGDGPATRAAVPSLPRRGLGTLVGCATALLGALYFLTAGTALGPFLLRSRTRAGALEVLTADRKSVV